MKTRIYLAVALILAFAALSPAAAQTEGAELRVSGFKSRVRTNSILEKQNSTRAFSAHRNIALQSEYITCPLTVPAAMTEVPSGWQQVEVSVRFTLPFDSVDFLRQGGKPIVACNYRSGPGFGVIIFRELPPSYTCTKTTDPRQVRCGSVIKIPKK